MPRWPGLAERTEDLAVGREVGTGQAHVLSPGAQRQGDEVAHDAAAVRRTVRHDGDALGAARRRRRAQHFAPRQIGAVGAEPALEEDRFEVLHRRTLDLDVRVAPRRAGTLRADVVLVADVQPAGEGDAAVDDQHLAVIAPARQPARVQAAERIEGHHVAAGGAQTGQRVGRIEAERADRVVEQTHGHALARLRSSAAMNRRPVTSSRRM